MSEIEKDAQKSIENLDITNADLARDLAELDFTIKYDDFLEDGEPKVLFSGIFIGNDNENVILYEKGNEKHIFPYRDTEQRFINIFVNELQGGLAKYQKRETRTVLIQNPDIPEALFNFIGKEVKAQTISYFIHSMGDRKFRKIEHTRYFYPDNDNLPLFEIWEAKSLDGLGGKPWETKTGKEVTVFAK